MTGGSSPQRPSSGTGEIAAPSNREILHRCEKLVDGLVGRAAEAEALRSLPDATITEIVDADLLRMVVPSSAGGMGLGLETLAQSTRILAAGCPASAWTISFFVMHNWLLGAFSAEARAEVFADRPWVFAPAPLSPTGTLRPAGDGFVLNGRWEWATGVNHADWVMVHAIVDRPGSFETRFALVPIDDVVVEDVWHTSGMRATGSNAVSIEHVEISAHRTIIGRELLDPSTGADGDGMEGLPVMPVLAIVAAAPALGAAEAAVELFRRRLAERVLAYTAGDRQIDQPASQVRLADALATVRAARAVWEAAIGDLETARTKGKMQPLARAAARLAAASTVRLSRQAISTVCEGAGASVYATSSPLQRLQRDVEVLKGHAVFDWDRCAELAGRLELGLERRPTDLL